MVILFEEDVGMSLCLYESASVHVRERGGVIMTVGGEGPGFHS